VGRLVVRRHCRRHHLLCRGWLAARVWAPTPTTTTARQAATATNPWAAALHDEMDGR
jgi:hypothetical protein